jgi:RNA polymerase sigma factor (sigma-70 family)
VDSLTDNQLMSAVRDGEIDKLGLLFENHHVRLFNFFVRLTGSRETSEDLVQDVFMRVLKYRNTFKAESSFVTWMYQIARNAQVDAWRKRRSEVRWDEVDEDEASDVGGHDPTPDVTLNRAEDIDRLQLALNRLSEEKREVLILSRLENLSSDEIAKILGCDAGTVRVRVHRALKELKEVFCTMG